MHILAFICENGVGHYKRTIGILNAIREQDPNVKFTVACAAWQPKRLADWEPGRKFWSNGAERLEGIVDPGVRWSTQASSYKGGELLTWHKTLSSVRQLKEADLVLSDNLPQVLMYRQDTILLGSFLWSDVLAAAFSESEIVDAFAAEETEVLEKYKPAMIANQYMAMPGVEKKTRMIGFPWFCVREEYSRNSKKKFNVAITGGATDSVADLIAPLALALAKSEKFEVFVPGNIYTQLPAHNSIHSFSFSDRSFKELDAIIARPGIGILTDAVKFSLPVFCMAESGNLEMDHNASQVEELGMGWVADAGSAASVIAELVIEKCSRQNLDEAVSKLQSMEVDGIRLAASWIINQKKDEK